MGTPGHSFPRPGALTLSVERRGLDGVCGACGASELAEYPVLSEGGWWTVQKCQSCLTAARREPAPRFGSYSPPGLDE